jgi:phage tail-like protein
MSRVAPTFRLLDAGTGWDAREDGLDGVRIVDGALTLTAAPPAPEFARWDGAPGELPDVLAWSPSDRTWWLGGPGGLRRLAPCDEEFRPWGTTRPVRAVAAGDGVVVVLLARGRGFVEIRDARTGHLVGATKVRGAVSVGLTRRGVVVVDGRGRLTHLDRSGLVCGAEDTCLPPRRALPRPAAPGLVTGDDGWCLPDKGCFDLDGRPVESVTSGGPLPVTTYGTFRSDPLDSGLPGCRWHRARIDADLPPGTGLRLEVATTDAPVDGHEPHPDDWYDAGPGVTDALLRTPPGRHAYLRLHLTGDGRVAPVVHRIRLDLPRHGGVDLLPAVYSEDPRAGDFTERFVGLFDAWLEQVDDVLDRRHALFDPVALPDDALGWLAGLVGLGFEPEMTVARRRALLAAAPDLYRRRGTPDGLLETLRLAVGLEASLEEPGTVRPWGAVGSARLGGVRLFGRTRARVRLGSSPLGGSRLYAHGDPDLDAVRASAHRLIVHLPSHTVEGRPVDSATLALATRVVRSQAPAHLATYVFRPRSGGLVAGLVRLGVDTVPATPAPAVVGRLGLGRGAALAPGRTAGLPVMAGRLVVGTGARSCTSSVTEEGTP